jgi:uncharacterized protein YbjT (DUF2867 family)
MADEDLQHWDADASYASPDSLPLDPDQEVRVVMGPLGDVAYISHQFDADEQLKVARLIAAAPELLEACKQFVALSAYAGKPCVCEACRIARAAIAKAEDEGDEV